MELAQNATLLQESTLGGETALIVMLVVFAVLALLYLFMALFSLAFRDRGRRAPKETFLPAAAQKLKSESTMPEQENLELIAVLTAAIMASRNQEGIQSGFRVVSFRRHS